jgi:hypothetical protein
MTELHEIVEWPEVDRPVLVVALEGWIDAGYAAATAMAHVSEQVGAVPIVRFDAEQLVDYRSRRPVVHLVEGVNTGITWPELELSWGRDASGSHVLLLAGPEPDLRWPTFVDEVGSLAVQFDVRLMVGLGGYPVAVPHTRPTRLSASASDASWAARIGGTRSTVDVPGGAVAVLERRMAELGIDAVTVWAQVPHYAAGMPNPASAQALVDAMARLADLDLDSTALGHAGVAHLQRLDELVSANPEHTAMVRQLEHGYDADHPQALDDGAPLPSGDELAAEVERFLREVRGE